MNVVEEQILMPQTLRISFPNDEPKEGNVNTIIDNMYKEMFYEIKDGCISNDGTSFGLNEKIYFITGLTEIGQNKTKLDVTLLQNDFSQYNQNGDCVLNQTLKDVFSDENNREYYDIEIVAGASKLFTDTYNEELGKRRANAAKN